MKGVYKLVRYEMSGFSRMYKEVLIGLYHSLISHYGYPNNNETLSEFKDAVIDHFSADGAEYEFPNDESYDWWVNLTPKNIFNHY